MHKKIASKITTFILELFFVAVLCSCTTNKEQVTKKPYFNSNITDNYNVTKKEIDIDDETKIIIDEIDKKDEREEKEISEKLSDNSDVLECVLYNVMFDLDSANFDYSFGQIIDLEDNNNYANGLYYSNNEFNIFEEYNCCGFYEILEDGEAQFELENNRFYEVVDLDNYDEYICSYSYDNIEANHFIYKNKYVKYYLESKTVIRYEVYNNDRNNYDINFGDLYSYDDNILVYDESFFEEYQGHNGLAITTDTDYIKIKNKVKELIEMQDSNSFNIEEVSLVYISPDALERYISSDETETFFGYNVKELEAGLGENTALEFKDGKFIEAKIIEHSSGYNWKNFLTKIGIGCGIIIVGAIGAVLSPYTGGTSFACAMMAITKVAVTFAITSAVIDLCVSTVTSFASGNGIKESLKNGLYGALDGFANGFVIGAVVGSVGVITGAIKPTACFVGTTLVKTKSGEKEIKDIKVGDYVYSYDTVSKQFDYKKVIETFKNKTNILTHLFIGNNEIVTTYNHPFYDCDNDIFIKASYLNNATSLLQSNNGIVHLDRIITSYVSDETYVYNFTVEDYHTYFVGDDEILVHNKCKEILSKKEANNASNAARKKLRRYAVNNSNKNSNVNMSDSIRKYIDSNGKLPDDAQVAHAFDVSRVRDLCNSGTISKDTAIQIIKDPKNMVIVDKTTHLKIFHKGSFLNQTDLNAVIEYFPELEEYIKSILAILG